MRLPPICAEGGEHEVRSIHSDAEEVCAAGADCVQVAASSRHAGESEDTQGSSWRTDARTFDSTHLPGSSMEGFVDVSGRSLHGWLSGEREGGAPDVEIDEERPV